MIISLNNSEPCYKQIILYFHVTDKIMIIMVLSCSFYSCRSVYWSKVTTYDSCIVLVRKEIFLANLNFFCEDIKCFFFPEMVKLALKKHFKLSYTFHTTLAHSCNCFFFLSFFQCSTLSLGATTCFGDCNSLIKRVTTL